jgi:hypothetical protein
MNQASIVCFADIDDSLITSSRHCPADGGSPIAFNCQGEVCAYLTPTQDLLFRWLSQSAVLVPTTARSSAGLQRVHLPFFGWAIVSFGGIILTPCGHPEPRWFELMSEQLAAEQPATKTVLALLHKHADGLDVRVQQVSDFGLNLYLSIKHNRRDVAELARLSAALAPELPADWLLHANGNFLAILPPPVRKELAVAWFLENVSEPGSLAIGFGDSSTDLPYMAACKLALMPTGAQNFNLLRERGQR